MFCKRVMSGSGRTVGETWGRCSVWRGWLWNWRLFSVGRCVSPRLLPDQPREVACCRCVLFQKVCYVCSVYFLGSGAMSTKKPRISITLDSHVYETLSRLSKLTKQSKSDLIGELLEAVHQPLMRTVALLEAVAEAPSQIRHGLRGTVQEMERQLVEQAGESFVQMDLLMGKLSGRDSGTAAGAHTQLVVSTSESTKEGVDGVGEAVPKASDPPLVTRGSGFNFPLPSAIQKG